MLDELNFQLSTKSYLGSDFRFSEEDRVTFSMLTTAPNFATHPHAYRWFQHIAALEKMNFVRYDRDSKDCVAREEDFDPFFTDVGAMFEGGISDRMKFYEKISAEKIGAAVPFENAFVIRLDGRSFSKLTKFLKKDAHSRTGEPFSTEFMLAMRKTADTLLREFKPATAYCHSDEITLIFPAITAERRAAGVQHLFSGRVQKLLSVAAGVASASFTHHLRRLLSDSISTECLAHYFDDEKGWTVFSFDARVVVFPRAKQDIEVVNNIVWRSKFDCFKNFVAMYAEKHFSPRELLGVCTQRRIEMLAERGIDVSSESIDMGMKFGTFLKRKQCEESEGGVGGDSRITRGVVAFSIPNLICDEDSVRLLLSPTLTDCPPNKLPL